jgi:hypothetical protein
MYMKKKTKRETAAQGGSAVASRPFASRRNNQPWALPAIFVGHQQFRALSTESALYSCRPGMTAKHAVVLVFEKVPDAASRRMRSA